MNGGVCQPDSNIFSCDCNGTGYGGPTCKTAIIYFDYIPPITKGTSIPIRLFTDANLQSTKRVDVTVKGLGKKKLFLRPTRLQAKTNVDGRIGTVTVSLPKSNEDFMYEPRQRTVFISSGSGSERHSYFEQLNLTKGQLKGGCCTPDTDIITCPQSTKKNISSILLPMGNHYASPCDQIAWYCVCRRSSYLYIWTSLSKRGKQICQ